MTWFFNKVEKWLTEVLKEFLYALLGFISDRLAPFPYWELPWATAVRDIVTAAAWSALVVIVLYEAWRLYIAREAGEATIPPAVLVRRALTAGAAIPLTSWGLTYLLDLANATTQAVVTVGSTLDTQTWGKALVEGVFAIGEKFGALFLYVLVVGVLLFTLFLLTLQSWIRGVELAIALILGPMCALSAARSDDALSSGLLGMWLKEVFVLSFTQVLQMALMLGVVQYSMEGKFEIMRVLSAIPLCYVALKAPTILRNYVYAAGGGWSGGGQNAIVSTIYERLVRRKPW